MKNKYLTEHERYQIEILLKENYPVKEIAKAIGKCPATIYNEIKRGTVTLRNSDWTERTVYQADVAQEKYNQNKVWKGRELKIGNDYDFVHYIETMIGKYKYSPCAVLADIRNKNLSFHTKICFKTLYNYIENGVFLGLSRYSLPSPRKAPRKPACKRTAALKSLGLRSIEERPKAIADRSEFGHWEMDTVVSGKGSLPALLVLTERSKRLEYIIKVPDKTTKSICTALNRLEKELGFQGFRERFKTITCDNGSEFKDMPGIETSCLYPGQKRTVAYYCHPYSSYERGSNENCNKLIRRWVPKGSDISQYSDEYIQMVEDWINNYPRKILGYQSAKAAMAV